MTTGLNTELHRAGELWCSP